MKTGFLTRNIPAAFDRRWLPKVLLALPFVFAAALVPGRADAATFTTFVNPHTALPGTGGTIGFAFAGNKFVGSFQCDGTGCLYSTDLTGGSVALFAPTASLASNPASEHFVASSLGLGGFPSRDIYVASGTGILHITNDGTSNNVFTSGLACPVRGITFDAIGTFGNAMLVTTNCGNVYSVTSAGLSTLLASVGEDTEGLDVAPTGTFGPFGGQLIVASEGSGTIRAITNTGTISVVISGIPGGPEELSVVPLNLGSGDPALEGMYGADYTPDVVKADATQFAGLQGDVVVTTEFGHQVFDIHFNGTTFVASVIGSFPNQPEDGIFVTATIINPVMPCTSGDAALINEVFHAPGTLTFDISSPTRTLSAIALTGSTNIASSTMPTIQPGGHSATGGSLVKADTTKKATFTLTLTFVSPAFSCTIDPTIKKGKPHKETEKFLEK